MKIRLLKAYNGDSILIKLKDEQNISRNILIDGGIDKTYKTKNSKRKYIDGDLLLNINEIKNQNELIDLLIMTHIDDDHIAGILRWFNDDKDADKYITEVWFNSGKSIAKFLKEKENLDLNHYIQDQKELTTSINQGKEFSEYIFEKGILYEKIVCQGEMFRRFGVEFKILSPNESKLRKLLKEWKKQEPDLKTAAKANDYRKSLKEHIANDFFDEDDAYSNGSSIAFILVHKNVNLLFLGDSHPSVIIEGLKHFGFSEEKPITAEFVKISHHGSKGNTSKELLKYIKSKNYFISTDGNMHEHPHKQFIGRLINEKNDCNIIFNYEERMKMIFSEVDKKDFPNFTAVALNEFEL